MWHVIDLKFHGNSSHRSNHKRHRGFSHPARFEVLEERLPLTAPAGGNAQLGTAAQFGVTDLGGVLMAQNGLEPLPGSGSELSGNNPGQPALVGVWGTADPTFLQIPGYDNLAFNNPSWIPNDRTQNPATSPDNNGLPINVYQEVATPSGIRNFEIGANTSIAHGRGSPIGQNTPTATRPVPLLPRFGQAIEHPLDGGLRAEKDAGDKPEHAQPAHELVAMRTDLPPSRSPQGDEENEALSLTAKDGMAVEPASASSPLDESAVDQMMAEADDMQARVAGAAVCEVAVEDVPPPTRGDGTGIHTVAAGLAMGVTLTMQRPAIGTSLNELMFRATKKPWPPQRDNHGKTRTRR